MRAPSTLSAGDAVLRGPAGATFELDAKAVLHAGPQVGYELLDFRARKADLEAWLSGAGSQTGKIAKPVKQPDVKDIIARIKKGEFPGADYVLFGTVSDIDFRQDVNELANTDSYSAILGLTLVADFSLINTRTYEVKAAFSAMGEGQDVKILSGSNVAVPNRSKVIMEVSKTLGEDVARQLQEQFDPSVKRSSSSRRGSYSSEVNEQKSEEVMILK